MRNDTLRRDYVFLWSKESRKPKRFTGVLDSVVGPQGFEPWTDGLKDH
jgi:hypothetical protein